MRVSPRLCRLLLVVLSSLMPLAASLARAQDSAELKALFADPPRQFSSAPLWVWNDMLTDDQIRQTLQDLAGQKVKQAFVHPRPGLMTPYLSDDWYRLWKVALDEAERLDMNLWIYDENSYPSGFAGGWVPQRMPESRGRGLRFEEVKQVPPLGEDVLGVYTLDGDKCVNITAAVRSGQPPRDGRTFVVRVARAPDQDWTAGRCYVDLLHPGVTEKFIDVTMEAYRRQIGDQFGGRVPGWFTDEPHLAPFGAPHWSDHLPEAFQQRWGYDLMEHLPSLNWPVGDWKRVRHNYFQLLLEQFIDRWAKPCYEYCERNHLEFTGHYWEHGWPSAGHGGDNMAMYAWHQRPAIDNLMNLYSEDVNGQFGNSRTVKELSSVANQLGRERTLCEAYGAGGWDLRFEDMKRIGDWLYVLGVNTLDEHLSYITLRGTRKRDHPQSFSYHEPWWNEYHVMAAYFTRLSAALSRGRQVNEILVLEPTTAAWMYQPDGSTRPQMMEIGVSFQQLVNDLERAQVEYDLGCEDILARHGAVDSGEPAAAGSAGAATRLVVGQRKYHTLVLPPHTENLNSPTIALLEKFLAGGGRVLSCGEPAERVDGAVSGRVQTAAQSETWQKVDASHLPELLLVLDGGEFSIQRDVMDPGILFHQRRRLADGELLLLVNTSIEHASGGIIRTAAQGAERWDPATGRTESYPAAKRAGGIDLRYDLPPCGSLLLLLTDSATRSSPAVDRTVREIGPAGPLKIHRMAPNVLTLDFVDLKVGGETRTGIYCYNAAQLVFQKHGFEKNPWDHAVQFRDEIIRHEFAPDSGFELTYRFRISQSVPKGLKIVIERPDLYAISVNGQPAKETAGAWWLDRAFGCVELEDRARVGENSVTLTASPMTVFHEVEPAYLLGDFSAQAADSGFVLAPPVPLELGPWNKQGLPLYSHGVAYAAEYQIDDTGGEYFVRLPSWLGSIAKVVVNGQLAGHFVSRPWEVDVTEQMRAGRNTIEVQVIGTLKNTLGPHHGQPVLGKAWPWDFRQAPAEGPPPGAGYHTVGYGLFEPPVLVERR